MRLIARLRAFVHRLLAPRRAERDLDDDVRSYADMLADELRASGLPADEARRRARVALGGVESVKESVRDVRAGATLELLWRDGRGALRRLRRSPGFTITAVLTIGLGIGVNTTLFTVVDSALFKPIPYAHPEELVRAWRRTAQGTLAGELTWAELAELRRTAGLLRGIEMYDVARSRPWRERDETIVVGAFTPGMPALLGVTPVAGRVFTTEEAHTRAPIVVIADALWARAFGRRSDAIGATITLDNRQLTIVGIMPAHFRFPFGGPPGPGDAWTPLVEPADTASATVSSILRLESGLALEAAHEGATLVADRIQQERAPADRWAPLLIPLDRTQDARREDLRQPTLMLLATAGLVLLVACLNVANLLLTRAASRQPELALRAALGATRGRLLQVVAAEAAVVAVAGGAVAMLLAAWTLDVLVAFVPTRLAQAMFQISAPALDHRVLAFAIGVTALVALLTAAWPALASSRRALRASIGGAQPTGQPHNRRHATRVLQTVQVGLAYVLAMTAGLFATSFATLLATDLGFDPRGLGVVRFTTTAKEPDAERVALDDALARVRTVPGVARAAIGGTPASYVVADVYRPGENDPATLAAVRLVGPGYLETAGIRLIAGRDFGPQDRSGAAPVAIIDEEGARRIFGTGFPLGYRFRHRPQAPETTIVGVVGVVKAWNFIEQPGRVQLYLPALSRDVPMRSFIVRTGDDLASALTNVRAALELHNATIRVTAAEPAADYYERMDTYAPPRFYLVLVSLFAVLALVTTAVGLYGLLAHAVGQRQREIGVRVTLGATPRQVCGLVLREALAPVLVGIALGALATWWTTDLIASLLYGIGPRDPRALALAAAALVAVAVAAAIVPIRRATGVDPVYALRLE
jgi:predicted permease